MKIEVNKAKRKVDDKRFYHGHKITDECPRCKRTAQFHDYLSYPLIDEPICIYFYCEHCNFEWTGQIKLTINIEQM